MNMLLFFSFFFKFRKTAVNLKILSSNAYHLINKHIIWKSLMFDRHNRGKSYSDTDRHGCTKEVVKRVIGLKLENRLRLRLLQKKN